MPVVATLSASARPQGRASCARCAAWCRREQGIADGDRPRVVCMACYLAVRDNQPTADTPLQVWLASPFRPLTLDDRQVAHRRRMLAHLGDLTASAEVAAAAESVVVGSPARFPARP